ncbi:histidine kinase [Halobacteriales archaeon QS_6_71_20]|nr:MAG: histidine kinase [Halobacteriales archaeon QS_6_71_20]
MASRDEIADLLRLDDERFRARFPSVLDADEYDAGRATRLADGEPAPDDDFGDFDDLDNDRGGIGGRERALIRRIRVLDGSPLGITLTGPAYADNPLVYADRTFRELTGYALDELRGHNLRLLQGEATESEPVATLAAALSAWNRATVTLTNYRADGTTFRNRVSIVPVTDDGGTVVNWIGLQRAVE